VQEGPELFQQTIAEHLEVIEALRREQPVVERIAAELSRVILSGKKIIWCGNGGSAADSQHLSAELVGRFLRERRGLASISLACDSSVITGVGNDFGYDDVFRRQIEALCQPGDAVVGLSTSGSSRNVCAALEAARAIGAYTAAFTGQRRSAISDVADDTLHVPSSVTARIQEGYFLCGHFICDSIERAVHARVCAVAETGVV
jgi:D-sedoheptulose 7-phosphate isomerase